MSAIPIITPDSFDYRKYMFETEPKVKVLGAETWESELLDRVRNGHQIRGARLPWSKTHDNIRFREGEVTLWSGISGHGKSQLLGQVSVCLANQGERVCNASLEMTPIMTMDRILRQTAGNDHPSEQAVKNLTAWAKGRYWLYDQTGSVKPQMIYAVIRYCSEKLKIKHVIIDSLMKCVRGEDDYNGQKDFVTMLCSLAHECSIHIHLVHHVRKGETEEKVPGKFDAKGTGAITDQVDQIITCWRNKKKERLVKKMIQNNEPIDDDTKGMPDELLVVDKNRNGNWEGRVALWYHPQSLQYTGDSRCIPLDMISILP